MWTKCKVHKLGDLGTIMRMMTIYDNLLWREKVMEDDSNNSYIPVSAHALHSSQWPGSHDRHAVVSATITRDMPVFVINTALSLPSCNAANSSPTGFLGSCSVLLNTWLPARCARYHVQVTWWKTRAACSRQAHVFSPKHADKLKEPDHVIRKPLFYCY